VHEVSHLAVQGIISGQSPPVTQIARGVERTREGVWLIAKRVHRFLEKQHFSYRNLLQELHRTGKCTVAPCEPSHLVVASAPVGSEKPYMRALYPPCVRALRQENKGQSVSRQAIRQ